MANRLAHKSTRKGSRESAGTRKGSKRSPQRGQPGGPRTIQDLTPDPKNARKHTKRNLETITAGLTEVGAARSIVIDEAGVIMAGNATAEAAMAAGLHKLKIVDADGETLVAVRRRGLNARAKARLALFDNRSAELAGGWDADILKELQGVGVSLDELWSDDELAKLIGDDDVEASDEAADNVPALRRTDIKLGDLFALGRHRILCGDSSRMEEVERVLGDVKPAMVFTDPPFGVNVTGKTGAPIAGDLTFTAIPLMFDVIGRVLAPKGWAYVCGGATNLVLYTRLIEREFRQLPRLIVWDKGKTAVMRKNGYHSCYELIYCAFREGGGNLWFGARDSDHADDIWRIAVTDGVDQRVHVAQKPVALPARAIGNSCPPEGSVFEPFSGSASTLIACECEKRSCYALEIEPAYVQVAIDRWETYTGKKAEKVGEATAG